MSQSDGSGGAMSNIKKNHAALYQYMADNVAPGSQQLSCMSPHIYVGTFDHAENTDLLKATGITAVLTLAEADLDKKVVSVYRKRKMQHLYIAMTDDAKESIQHKLQDAYKFIHDVVLSMGKVLVHCKDGTSRSVAVVMYYYLARLYATNYHKSKKIMMRLLDPSNSILMEVAQFIKGRRPCALPNIGYAYQLVMMEYAMKSYYSKGIVDEALEIKQRIIDEGDIDPGISHIIEAEVMSVPHAIELVYSQETSEVSIVDERAEDHDEYDDIAEIPSLLGTV